MYSIQLLTEASHLLSSRYKEIIEGGDCGKAAVFFAQAVGYASSRSRAAAAGPRNNSSSSRVQEMAPLLVHSLSGDVFRIMNSGVGADTARQVACYVFDCAVSWLSSPFSSSSSSSSSSSEDGISNLLQQVACAAADVCVWCPAVDLCRLIDLVSPPPSSAYLIPSFVCLFAIHSFIHLLTWFNSFSARDCVAPSNPRPLPIRI